MSSTKSSKPNTPNRFEVESRSPGYEPPPREDSEKSDEDDETQDQDMSDPTAEGDLSNIEESADPHTQEEAEELFMEALIVRNQNGELNTIEEVVRAIFEIGGEAISDDGLPITFTARIALKLMQRSDPLSLLIKNYEQK